MAARDAIKSLCFDAQSVALFAAASHDDHALHRDTDAARRGPFGEPIVFGILGALAAISLAGGDGDGASVQAISIHFHRPLFVQVNYQVRIDANHPGQVKLSIEDAGLLMTSIDLRLRETAGAAWSDELEPVEVASPPTPLSLHETWTEGFSTAGRYVPEAAAFSHLASRYRLVDSGLSAGQAAALLWSSFLIGARYPGGGAVFSAASFAFAPAAAPAGVKLDYAAHVTNVDDRFGLIEMGADLTRSGVPLARVQLSAFTARDPVCLDVKKLNALLPRSPLLKVKTALVVGGSRGLGAALVGALASQGCDVLLNCRNTGDATTLQALLQDQPGTVVPMIADAADSQAFGAVRDLLQQRGRGLDVLIANASPPLRPQGDAPEAGDRLRAFVDRVVSLAETPLKASRDLLELRSGAAVLISSAWAAADARNVPRGWAHYVSAKCAVEGLFNSLAHETRSVHWMIVRPPRMLTNQTNTPGARLSAVAVECVAAKVIARLMEPTLPRISIMDDFTPAV